MAPRALSGVVDLAAGGVALPTSKPGAPLEIDPQLKPPLTSIEGGLHHPPRRPQPQGGLKQLDISHRATVRDTPSQLPRYPATHTKRRGTRYDRYDPESCLEFAATS